jgi:hypothetical protein
VYGVKAKQYITGAGDELFLVLKRDWLDYPVGSASTNTPTGGHMVIVDPDYINLAWFRPTRGCLTGRLRTRTRRRVSTSRSTASKC